MNLQDFLKLFKKDKVFSHNDCECFNTTSDKLLKIPIWNYQRELNEDHLEKLTNEIFKTTTILTPFIAIYVKTTGEIVIVDGQHRIEAIKRIIKSLDKNFSIPIELKLVRRDTDTDIIDLYKKLNTSLGFKESDLPTEPVIILINDLISLYGAECIRGKRKSGCYMDSRVLQKKLTETNILLKYDCRELFNKICIKNKELKEKYSGQNDKADKLSFWLGLDEKFQWLYDIKYDNCITI